jgi:hypothetical protein
MSITTLKPGMLAFVIVAYFLLFSGLILSADILFPGLDNYLPVAGRDARDIASIGNSDIVVESTLRGARSVGRYAIALTLITYLACSVLIMLPVTWVYMATHQNVGFKRNFVVSLLVFPIVTTTVVLLIQDSLSLAFGLAALVAAVRFRIRLQDALDGIYVLTAISVGLSAGIGFVGVGGVTAMFFCLVSIALWKLGYAADLEVEKSKK